MTASDSSIESVLGLLKTGDLVRAGEVCRRVLDEQPDHAKAWHLLGIVRAQQDELAAAAECFEKAIQCRGDVASYHYNLALACQSLKDFDGALAAYRAAVEIKPDFVEAQNNLGNCLIDTGELTAAVEHFRQLGEQFPNESIVHYNLANVLQDAGEYDDSITEFRRAIVLDPNFTSARENLGRALADVTRYDEAMQVWNDWLKHDPDNAVAKHMIAAITGQQTPERCGDDYVRETFDHDFARSYEKQLERIQYKVPELIKAAIDSIMPDRNDLNILDAGCGTGLCASVLKPHADRLVGVDLSGDMLTEAEHLKVYDQLIEAELTEYLTSGGGPYDLIVSGDTFCYFGQLRQLLSGMAGCLAAGGQVVFTVERLAKDEEEESAAESLPEYDLQANGRYRHHESYVRETLNQAGLQIVSIDHGTLRIERGRDVIGLVVTAAK